MELDAVSESRTERSYGCLPTMQAARALGEGLHHPVRCPADAAEIDELEEMVALRKDLLGLRTKEEQESGSQGEAVETDPGFRFASE